MDWKRHIDSLIAAGATVPAIAGHMQVTPNAVKEILAGRTRAPRADAAFRLAGLSPSTPLQYDSDGRVIAYAVPLPPIETGKDAAVKPA